MAESEAHVLELDSKWIANKYVSKCFLKVKVYSFVLPDVCSGKLLHIESAMGLNVLLTKS